MKTIYIIFMTIFIFGCSTNKQIEHYSFISKSSETLDYGSGTPWLDGYVVTAKHVDVGNNEVVHNCSNGCDLKFVKMNNSVVFSWREPKANEEIRTVGTHMNFDSFQQRFISKSINRSGKDSNEGIKIKSEGNTVYNLAKMDAPKGLSGGPVFSKDGYAIGILIGSLTETKSGISHESAVYIPYSTIIYEWNKYKKAY